MSKKESNADKWAETFITTSARNIAKGSFIQGYEQAIKDIKECIDKRYELHRPEYLKTRSSYLEGVLDGIDTIEQDVDELAED